MTRRPPPAHDVSAAADASSASRNPGPPLASALEIVLQATSVGASKQLPVHCGTGCRKRSGGSVQVFIGHDALSRRPDAANVLLASPKDHEASTQDLYLGKRGGIWTPRLRLFLSEQRGRKPLALAGSKAVFVIAQSRDNAEYLLDGCQTLGLSLAAVVCLDDDPPLDWKPLVSAVARLGQVPLLALEHPLAPADLAATHPEATTLLLTAGAELCDRSTSQTASYPSADATPLYRDDAVAMARALGWAALDRPAQAIEAARLLALGVRPKTRRVLGLARTARAADHLQRAMTLAGLLPATTSCASQAQLPLHRQILLAPARQYMLSRALAKLEQHEFDVVLCAGRVPRALGINCPQLSIGPVMPPEPVLPAGEATLNALAALLDVTESNAPSIARARPLPEVARLALLDPRRTHPRLGAQRAREILGACLDDLPATTTPTRGRFHLLPALLVTSGSAAASAAKKLTPPLWMRAVGPGLSWDTPATQLEAIPNAAAARQGFHDLLFSCQQHLPDQPLDGVLVSPEWPRRGQQLEILLYWIEGIALARVSARLFQPSGPPAGLAPSRWLSCANEHVLSAETLAEGAFLRRAADRRGAYSTDGLSQLLSALCQASAALKAMMRWLLLWITFDEQHATIVEVDGESTWPRATQTASR